MSRSIKRAFIVALALATAGAAAACGGSSAGSGGNGQGGDSSASVAAAAARVAGLSQPIKIDYAPGPPPEGYAGKTIAIVSNETATGRHSAELQAAAAQKLGLKTKVFAVAKSAEEIANTFDQIAADTSIAGLIVGSIDPSAWTTQFKALQARNVPVVLYAVRYDPAWNTKMVISIESERSGVARTAADAADWIIADSRGSADTVVFNGPVQPILNAVYEAFAAQYSKQCPACKLAKHDIDLATIGRTLPGTVVSYLQAHPNTKYAYFEFGDMVTGVPQAMKAAGISGVKIVSQAATATNMQYIRDGSEAANFSYPLGLVAYIAVDAVARGMTTGDMSAAGSWVLPVQLMTKDNLDGGTFNPDGTTTPPGMDAYFEKLWATRKS